MDKIKKMYLQNFREELREPFSSIKRKLRTSYHINLYTINEEIIGFIIYTPIISSYYVFVNYFCIDSKHQGKGYGKLVFNAFLEQFEGYSVLLDCESHLDAFYEKFGFRKIGTAYFNTYSTSIMIKGDFVKYLVNYFYTKRKLL